MMTAPHAGRVTDIVQRQFGLRGGEKVLVGSSERLKGLRTACRKREQVRGLVLRIRTRISMRVPHCSIPVRLGSLFQHHMSIGAAEAERTDARQCRAGLRRPWTERGLHPQWELDRKEYAGWASRKCRLGGISRCWSASATLIRPAMPAAASRWPILVLTEPTAQGFLRWTVDAKHRAQGFHLDRVAQQCAGAVGLDVLNVARAKPRRAGRLLAGRPPGPADSEPSVRCCVRPGSPRCRE